MQEQQIQEIYHQSQESIRPISKQSSVSNNSVSPRKNIKKYNSVKKQILQNHEYISLSPNKYQKYSNKKNYFQRSSLSPNRKHLYWQNWLLPNYQLMNSCIQLPPSVSATSYCSMLVDTNQILISNKQNLCFQVASLTKILTAYTVLCICNTYGIKIRQHTITIHRQASLMEGTSANLHIGDQLFVIDLLYGLLLPSGNDAAIALAQYFGKFLSFKLVQDSSYNLKQSKKNFNQYRNFYDTEYKLDSIKLFVFEMNKQSHKIGLTNTYFTNPTGLNDPKSYSTAKDMAILSSHCLKNHTLRSIFKKKVYVCQAKNQKLLTTRQIQWKNTNRHLFQFRQCIGIKTGITPNAGPCLSSAYKVLGRQIVIIVLKCLSTDQRYKDIQNLYKWCRKKIIML